MMREPSLDGPRAKFDRASQHINALDNLLTPLTNRDAYIITRQFDREKGQQIWALSSEPPTIPIDASLLIGDAVYNLRSALDHLVWQLVLLNGAVPTKRNEFPIFRSPDEYEGGKTKRLSGVSQAVKTLVDGFQPYNSNHRALWVLRVLSNTDKHRHLYLTVTSVLRATFIQPSELTLSGLEPRIYTGPIERGTVLCTFPSDNMDVQFTPTFDVAFRQSDPRQVGGSVMSLLRPVQVKVDEVLSRFSHLFS